jgi:serine/threonine protein kinase
MPMFCRNCGTGLPDGAAFCANCGHSTTAPGTQSVATATDSGEAVVDTRGEQLLTMVKAELGKDYRIEKEVGRGGMAVVYRAVEVALDRTVAIKVVPPDSANVGQVAERFKREAKLAASLDHPNIIPVYRVGQAGPLHFMAMKFVEGRAVDAIIEQQGALPLSVCTAILRASSAGLAFAHEKKVVHRDIKAANILVDRDGRVMVSDFGIARALEDVSLTASGMMIGTPYYMSPEQCGGQKVSPQSDQYSLGIMGFQMLTGEVPFLADSMVGVIQHHYLTPVPDILTVRPGVPKELLDVIYCALNKDPNDRFPTTKDMVVALDNVPMSDVEREESDRLLRELSTGATIPKVRTGTLPPLALTISGPGPRVQPRPVTSPLRRPTMPAGVRRRKKNRKLMYQGFGIAGLAIVAAGFLGYQQIAESAAKRRADSLNQLATIRQQEAERAAAAAWGKLVFVNLPAEGRVVVGGRLFHPNTVDSVSPGNYRASATADGFEPRSRDLTVAAGRTDTVDMSMSPLSAAAPVAAAPQTARPAPVRIVADSSEVRFVILPTHAEVMLDNRKLGQGRFRMKLPVGEHALRLTAFGCRTEPIDIVVRKDISQVVSRTLSCDE